MACQSDERISDFPTPIGTQYIIRDQAILQLVLSQFRNKEGGLFYVPENEKIFIDGFAKDLYPEEMTNITDDEQKIISAIFLTAESAHIHSLRSYIIDFLKPKAVQEYKDQLSQIAREILDQLSPSEKQSCDPAKLSLEFTVAVIGRLFTGYNDSRENYQKVVQAILTISKHLGNSIIKRPASKTDKIEYKTALQTMRDLIEHSMNLKPAPNLIISLRESGLSEVAIKMYLFFFYLAGTETTSVVLHYLLLQLGQNVNKQYQEMIRKEQRDSIVLKKCVIEALRLHPPVFIMGRALRRDVLITIRDSDHSLIWAKHLKKGHYIISWVSAVGKNPHLYPNPEAFNPLRYETIPTQLPWLPFTTGPHTCPGQFLAKAKMESFISEILLRFDIQAIPSNEPIESKGTFLLHADPNSKIKIRFVPYSKST